MNTHTFPLVSACTAVIREEQDGKVDVSQKYESPSQRFVFYLFISNTASISLTDWHSTVTWTGMMIAGWFS